VADDIRTATPEDAPALVDLLTALEEADDTGEHWNLEDVEEMQQDGMSDPAKDWLLVERDGALVAATLLFSRAPADGSMRVGLLGGVRPGVRRQGIGARVFEAGVERARAHVRERGESLTPLVSVQARPDDRGLQVLAERAGMTPEMWSFAMEADLPRAGGPAVVPDDVTLHTWVGADPDELREAHNRAFTGHRGWSPWDADMWHRLITTSRHHRPELSLYLRGESGAVAAYVHVQEYDAAEQATGIREVYVSKVGTLPEHRGRGLAGTLLRLVLDRAADQGFGRAALDVDANNETGALSVYEQAGFAVTRRWVGYTGA
jgi:mycothiol synthase